MRDALLAPLWPSRGLHRPPLSEQRQCRGGDRGDGLARRRSSDCPTIATLRRPPRPQVLPFRRRDNPGREYDFGAYLGAPYHYPSDFHLVKPGVSDLTIKDIAWFTKPFDNPLYYGVRIQRWFEGGRFGTMLDFTHSKVYAPMETREDIRRHARRQAGAAQSQGRRIFRQARMDARPQHADAEWPDAPAIARHHLALCGARRRRFIAAFRNTSEDRSASHLRISVHRPTAHRRCSAWSSGSGPARSSSNTNSRRPTIGDR